MWKNLSDSTKNPNHQLIHHRMYLTPRRCYSMKITTSLNCNLCPLNCTGLFMHVYWECPGLVRFWKEPSLTLCDILKVRIPVSPALLLLNDDSSTCPCNIDTFYGPVSLQPRRCWPSDGHRHISWLRSSGPTHLLKLF